MIYKAQERMTTRELTLTAMFIALIAVGAWISLPIGLVSVTMQTLVVMVAGLVLPRRAAIMAVSGYLLLGLLGLPVFAGGSGGIAILAKPSLGFLLGFIPLVFVSTVVAGQNKAKILIGLLVANVLLYSLGFAYMYAYFNFFAAKPMSVIRILQIGILPYLPGDAIKIGLAVFIAQLFKRLS